MAKLKTRPGKSPARKAGKTGSTPARKKAGAPVRSAKPGKPSAKATTKKKVAGRKESTPKAKAKAAAAKKQPAAKKAKPTVKKAAPKAKAVKSAPRKVAVRKPAPPKPAAKKAALGKAAKKTVAPKPARKKVAPKAPLKTATKKPQSNKVNAKKTAVKKSQVAKPPQRKTAPVKEAAPMRVVASVSPHPQVEVKMPAKAALKQRYQMEFYLNATPASLFDLISSPSGFSEWFCDDVNVSEGKYTFKWGDETETAECLVQRPGESIRFRWDEDAQEDPGAYFEFRIRVDSMTNEICLVVTDHAWPADLEEEKALWSSQIQTLIRVLGA